MPTAVCEKQAERASNPLHDWTKNRKEVIRRIYEISDELNTLHRCCAISTVVRSSVGIGGGLAVIAGLRCSPVVANGASVCISSRRCLRQGLFLSGVAVAANLITRGIKVAMIKKRAKEVMELVRKDESLFKVCATEMKQPLRYHGEGSDEESTGRENGEAGGETMSRLQSSTIAARVFAAGARAAILQTARLAPAVMKGMAYGAAGERIVLSTLSLIASSRDLARRESLEFAENLRAMAGEMQDELDNETAASSGMSLPESQ